MRKIAVIVLGLGAFLLVLALMVRFYVYPSLAVAPENPDSTTILEAEDATIFDRGSLEEITTDLRSEVVTVGDTEAAEEAGGDTRVWVSKNSIRSSDGVIRSRSAERVAFDAVTAEAKNCCGAFDEVAEGEREAATREGLVFKFPFNTQKEDYEWWDSDVREAITAKYVGTEDVEGVEAYVFEQVVEPTVVGSIELPADMLGESGSDNIDADMTYSNKRTFYVEPNTGAILNRVEELDSTIAYEGTDRITTTQARMEYVPEQIKDNADQYGGQGSQLALIRNTVPLVLGVLGLLLLLAGLFMGRRRDAAHA